MITGNPSDHWTREDENIKLVKIFFSLIIFCVVK